MTPFYISSNAFLNTWSLSCYYFFWASSFFGLGAFLTMRLAYFFFLPRDIIDGRRCTGNGLNAVAAADGLVLSVCAFSLTEWGVDESDLALYAWSVTSCTLSLRAWYGYLFYFLLASSQLLCPPFSLSLSRVVDEFFDCRLISFLSSASDPSFICWIALAVRELVSAFTPYYFDSSYSSQSILSWLTFKRFSTSSSFSKKPLIFYVKLCFLSAMYSKKEEGLLWVLV